MQLVIIYIHKEDINTVLRDFREVLERLFRNEEWKAKKRFREVHKER